MTDLLSVVIPVGSVDEWLDLAVESVLEQEGLSDLDADFEVITVFNNGAAPPENWKYLTDSRIQIVYTPDRLGPAGAGQMGVEASRGELLVCLDSDDLMKPGRLRAQLQWMRDHPEAVLVGSQASWVDETGSEVGKFKLPTGDDVRHDLMRLNVCPHSTWMVRMPLVRKIGGYDLSMNQMEDYDFLLRIGCLGPLGVLSETLTGYRLHTQQLSRAVRPNGSYIKTIARSRKLLGEKLGVSKSRVLMNRFSWEFQQWLMYFGRKARTLFS